jgi:uncharacterized protein
MNATVWLTDDCNLACRYCYVAERRDGKHMTFRTAEAVVDFLRQHAEQSCEPGLVVNYHGGEPLLNFKVMEWISEELSAFCDCHGSSHHVFFTTNGTVTPEGIWDYFDRYQPIVSVSVEGSREVHDRLRPRRIGGGSYDAAMSFSAEAIARGVSVVARMTVDPTSVAGLADRVVELAGAGFEIVKPVPDFLDPTWTREDLEAFGIELGRLEARRECLERAGIRVSVLERHPAQRMRPCRVGPEYLNIAANGDLFPCSYVMGVDQFWFGDVFTGINAEFMERLNEASACATRSACEGCGAYDACEATRCTYINHRMTGDLGRPSAFFCEYQRLLKWRQPGQPAES